MIERLELRQTRRAGPVVYRDKWHVRWDYETPRRIHVCRRCGNPAVQVFRRHEPDADPLKLRDAYCVRCICIVVNPRKRGPFPPTKDDRPRCTRCRRPLEGAEAVEAGIGHACTKAAALEQQESLELGVARKPRLRT